MAHKIGMGRMMCLFVAGAVGLSFIDYGAGSSLLGHLERATVSLFVAFGLVNWLSQLAEIRLPHDWYRHRAVESPRLYRHLGVLAFRAALLRSPFRLVNHDIHLTARSRAALVELETHMRTVETNHVVALGLTVLFGGFYGIFNDLRFTPWFLGINIIGNAYPVMLQRYNRLSISRTLERAKLAVG